MITTAKEVKLLKQCQKGKLQAFEAIVTNYQDLICAITYSATADVQESEELAHQTFINAWKNLSQLKDLSRFRSWLCAIARNNIRNFINKNKRDIIAKAKPMENINDRAADESSPLESAIKNEHKQLVNDAIQQVPEQYRELLVLYYRRQKSVRQVAQLLDLSEDAVKQRLQRGRKMIKEQLSSIVEETLSATGPKKTFAAAVIASVAGMAIKGSGVAVAAGIAATSSKTGTAAVMSTVTAKIITAASVIAIGIGAVVTYKQVAKPNPEENLSRAAIITQEEEGREQQGAIEKAIEPASNNTAQMAAVEQIQTEPENEVLTVETSEPVIADAQIENEFVPKGVLSGLITDAQTGEPVTDAEVSIKPGRLYRTKTDENGFYSFDLIDKDGDYSIGVFSKQYIGLMDSATQPKMHLKTDGQAVKHFQLPRACMIDLYVLDEESNPVNKAHVWVTSLADEHGVEVGRSYAAQRTDENGHILLGGFSPSDKPYMITSTHSVQGDWVEKFGQRFRESVQDFAPGYFKVELTDPNVIEYGEIILRKGVQVHGVAKYPDGTPAKECQIVPYPDWWHSTTVPSGFKIDPNGLFTLNQITQGTYSIQAMIPSDGSSFLGITLFSTQLPLEEDELLEVTIPQRPVPPGISSGNRVVEAKLHGIVTDALTKKPIPGFRLRYQRMASSHYSDEGKWTQFNNSEGDFSLDVIGNDNAACKIQAVAKGYAPKWSEKTETGTAVLIELTRGGSISGTVVDGQGNPVINAGVLPYCLAGDIKTNIEHVFVSEEGMVTTDDSGRFTLENIPAGTETIKVIHPDYTFNIVSDISVKENGLSDIGKITLTNGGIIEGFVYDNQGNVQPGVTLYAQNHYGFSTTMKNYATEISDSNGYFRIENLPEELCYIVRPRAYELAGVVSRAIIPGNNNIIRQDLGGGPSIRGRLVIDGSPLTNTQIILTLGEPSADGLFRSHDKTDENGGFVLAAGQPGTYTISYEKRSKNYSTVTIKLLDIQVGSRDIDLGTVPGQEHTLTISIETSGQMQNSIQHIFLRESDPLEGSIIYWKDDPRPDTPYEICVPEPGLYYAVVQCDGGVGKYRFPIEIPEGQDNLDVELPIQEGSVTVTGVLPDPISHVYYTNYDHSIGGYIYNSKNKGGAFQVEGLFPGTYYLSPKWQNYDDSIIVTIPDSPEYTLQLDAAELIDNLKERVSVHVFDSDGRPAEYASIWIEREGRYLLPASQDIYSSVFYLPDGEHIIHAEKDGISATKTYRVNIDKNNTSSGESLETFIQLKQ